MDKTLNIGSIHNDRVKQWSRLLDKKGRDQQGKFLVEGTHLVMEAIRSGASIETIVFAEYRGIPDEITEAFVTIRDGAGRQIEWISVSEEVLVKCTDAQTPQGVFAVVMKRSDKPEVLWGGLPDNGGHSDQRKDNDVCEARSNRSLRETVNASLVVLVDGVQDPGNLGTIIRSADAVGATAVVIGRGTVDLYNPKTVRSTMGSLFHLPILEGDLEPLLLEAHRRGIQLVNTSLQATSSCYDVDFTRSTWFIVGNEARGVSDTVSSIANTHVIIPMAGGAESLNVAMAATVLLFEASRQRLYASQINSH